MAGKDSRYGNLPGYMQPTASSAAKKTEKKISARSQLKSPRNLTPRRSITNTNSYGFQFDTHKQHVTKLDAMDTCPSYITTDTCKRRSTSVPKRYRNIPITDVHARDNDNKLSAQSQMKSPRNLTPGQSITNTNSYGFQYETNKQHVTNLNAMDACPSYITTDTCKRRSTSVQKRDKNIPITDVHARDNDNKQSKGNIRGHTPRRDETNNRRNPLAHERMKYNIDEPPPSNIPPNNKPYISSKYYPEERLCSTNYSKMQATRGIYNHGDRYYDEETTTNYSRSLSPQKKSHFKEKDYDGRYDDSYNIIQSQNLTNHSNSGTRNDVFVTRGSFERNVEEILRHEGIRPSDQSKKESYHGRYDNNYDDGANNRGYNNTNYDYKNDYKSEVYKDNNTRPSYQWKDESYHGRYDNNYDDGANNRGYNKISFATHNSYTNDTKSRVNTDNDILEMDYRGAANGLVSDNRCDFARPHNKDSIVRGKSPYEAVTGSNYIREERQLFNDLIRQKVTQDVPSISIDHRHKVKDKYTNERTTPLQREASPPIIRASPPRKNYHHNNIDWDPIGGGLATLSNDIGPTIANDSDNRSIHQSNRYSNKLIHNDARSRDSNYAAFDVTKPTKTVTKSNERKELNDKTKSRDHQQIKEPPPQKEPLYAWNQSPSANERSAPRTLTTAVRPSSTIIDPHRHSNGGHINIASGITSISNVGGVSGPSESPSVIHRSPASLDNMVDGLNVGTGLTKLKAVPDRISNADDNIYGRINRFADGEDKYRTKNDSAFAPKTESKSKRSRDASTLVESSKHHIDTMAHKTMVTDKSRECDIAKRTSLLDGDGSNYRGKHKHSGPDVSADRNNIEILPYTKILKPYIDDTVAESRQNQSLSRFTDSFNLTNDKFTPLSTLNAIGQLSEVDRNRTNTKLFNQSEADRIDLLSGNELRESELNARKYNELNDGNKLQKGGNDANLLSNAEYNNSAVRNRDINIRKIDVSNVNHESSESSFKKRMNKTDENNLSDIKRPKRGDGTRLDDTFSKDNSNLKINEENKVLSERSQKMEIFKPILPIPLKNPRGYCFLNSVIQVLRCCLEFVFEIVEYHEQNKIVSSTAADDDKMFTNYFCKLINDMIYPNKSKQRSETLELVQNFFQESGDGDDVQKCFMIVLSKIHMATKKTVNISEEPQTKEDEAFLKYRNKNHGFVFDLFFGQMSHTSTCKKCHSVQNKTFQLFKSLPLPLPDNCGDVTLSKCIEAFLEPSDLTSDDTMECKCPNGSNELLSKSEITHGPKYLFIYLSRGSYYVNGVKNNNPVTFNKTLYLPTSKGAVKYKLISIIEHMGNNEGGHYYCKCNYEGRTWWCISDEQVTQTNSDFDYQHVIAFMYKKS